MKICASLAHFHKTAICIVHWLVPCWRELLLTFDTFVPEFRSCAYIHIHSVTSIVVMRLLTGLTKRHTLAAFSAQIRSIRRQRLTHATCRSFWAWVFGVAQHVLDVIGMDADLLCEELAVVFVRSQAHASKLCFTVDGAHHTHLDALLTIVALIDREHIYPHRERNLVQSCLPKHQPAVLPDVQFLGPPSRVMPSMWSISPQVYEIAA